MKAMSNIGVRHFETRIKKSGLNFINVLRTAFTHADPESVRIQSNPQYLFTLLGSAHVKAVRRTLMKLTPAYRISAYFTNSR